MLVYLMPSSIREMCPRWPETWLREAKYEAQGVLSAILKYSSDLTLRNKSRQVGFSAVVRFPVIEKTAHEDLSSNGYSSRRDFVRQQQGDEINPPPFNCIPHVQRVCQLDSAVCSLFSAEHNSLIPEILLTLQKVSHVQRPPAGLDVGVNQRSFLRSMADA